MSDERLIPREEEEQGRTYDIKIVQPEMETTFFVTINHKFVDGKMRPMELFIHTSHGPSFEHVAAISLLVSALLRARNERPEVIMEGLGAIVSPFTEHWRKGEKSPSLYASVGDCLREHMEWLAKLRDI